MPAYRLPLPPSANNLVRPARIGPARCKACNSMRIEQPAIRLVSTTDAREFREQARRKLPREPIPGPVEMYLTVYVASLSSDGPNREKAIEDAIKERLIYDDCQIAEWHGRKVVCVELVAPVLGERDKRGRRPVITPGTYAPPLGVVIEVRPADPLEHPELSKRLARSTIQERENERAQSQLFAETTEGGASMPRSTTVKPSDARGGAVGAPRPRAVLPESMQQRIARLARPASYPAPDDDPKGAA